MLELHSNFKEKETQLIVVSKTNYSKDQIKSLFQLGRLKPVLLYKGKAKKLFDLGLSFDDSKYLLQTKGLSVNDIVKCIRDFKLDVNLIKNLTCSNDELLTDIPDVISMVGGEEYLRILIIDKKLSIDNIRALFRQLELSYKDTISLINCGYKVYEIQTLINGKITCSGLIELASAIESSEIYSIFKEDRQNLVFLLSVISVIKKKISDLNSALDSYQILYDSISNNLCKSLINYSNKYCPCRPAAADPNVGYEEIMIYYMDLAGGNGLMTADIPNYFINIEKVIKFFKPSYVEVIEKYFPVKPFILAAIWSALGMSLGKRYLKDTEIDSEVVGRSVLSFLISSMCGVTGYFHSGGVGLPFPNITHFMERYFSTTQLIKNKARNIYVKIPECLLFDTNQEFENLITVKQIRAAQGLSMVYTFRVGNAFLCSLLGTNVLSFESARNIFKSLWPLPQESESIRMYYIYSGIPVYSSLNINDVFVSIS